MREEGLQIAEGILEEAGVVADELDGGIDFVGDAGCQAAHGFQLLRVAQFHFRRVPAGNVAGDALHPHRLPASVDQAGFHFRASSGGRPWW